ncbi:hypothetical protein CVIRNUC_009226 [Coccomyxa viridis]|uniref:RING-type E3 ubiquitin transferase n=1 Tax=Coccomyxa viridis TaxID=1274662 RepID=A0AAV1IJ96_9CHLO|nr:hypothetical protein CVIRNUC_009226 [Coccomyxa viridis]
MDAAMQRESEALRRAFKIRFNDCSGAQLDNDVILLESAGEEISEETGIPISELHLSKDNLERALMAKLMEDITEEWPLHYLMASYNRLSDELRSLTTIGDQAVLERVTDALIYGKQLTVSYSGLLLSMDMFPQPHSASQRGALQLLDALDKKGGKMVAHEAYPMPTGFLEDLAARFEQEGLDSMLGPTVFELMGRLLGVSPLGDYDSPMQLLIYMTAIKPIARMLVRLPKWAPLLDSGRGIQTSTLLGPAFALGVIPDAMSAPRPSVFDTCLRGLSRKSPQEMHRTQETLRTVMHTIYSMLHTVAMNFLKSQDTREGMLSWLALALQSNAERGKMQMDPRKAANHSFFISLNAVLLKLCEPFLEPLSGKAWGKVDPSYITGSKRIDHKEDTKLAVDAEEQEALIERMASGSAASAPSYHFICECFFLTARSLHLGFVKTVQDTYNVARTQGNLDRDLRQMEGMVEEMRRRNDPLTGHYERQTEMVKTRKEQLGDMYVGYAAAVSDEDLLKSVLGFYRLMAAWMLRLASPAAAAGGQPQLPLPTPAPEHFRLLPEYFVEDMIEVLMYVSRFRPQVLEGVPMEELLLFFVTFMGSPAYIKNPYLRSRMVEVLSQWMPMDEEPTGRGAWGRRRTPQVAASVLLLIDSHPLVLNFMVRNIFQLYADIEHTSRNNAFYEKYNLRYSMGELLQHLWDIPAHRQAWERVAHGEGGFGQLYHSFCHFLETDAIYLLNDAVQTLPLVKEMESKVEDTGTFSALPQEEQQELEQTLSQNRDKLRSDLTLAGRNLSIMRSSTEAVTAPWLIREMAPRIASTLNYFLLHLTGPERRKLKIKDAERYGWQPKEMLAEIASIYVHLGRADQQAIFARAIANDERSFRQEMFAEASKVLRQFMLLPEVEIQELDGLARRVHLAMVEKQQEEELLQDPPDEFKDSLMDTLMEDPVILPASRAVLDRSTINRILLSDAMDPLTRTPLKEEDLIPDVALKSRIEAWKAEMRKQAAEKVMQQ